MKTILGLDLGTNSIGWALVEHNFSKKEGKILGLGSRIIPMSQDILGEFGKGNSVSQTAERTRYRSVRRLRERYLLRRERLHRVLNVLGFLPEHYANQIDFDKHPGKIKKDAEPKLAYRDKTFLFQESFSEMLRDFEEHQPGLLVNKKGEKALIPYDWTIYYLRKKALTQKITPEELAWIILNFNQKRGYYQLRGEEKEENPNKLEEFHTLKVVDIIADEPQKGKAEIWYSLILENGWIYRRSSKTPLDNWLDKYHDFIVTTDLNDDGTVKTDREGNEKRSFRAPKEDDWTLRKKKTENDITQSRKTVGEYIYDSLLKDSTQKIRGQLVRTIERKYYTDELRAILKKQQEFHPELKDEGLYAECVRELYKSNQNRQQQLNDRNDFVALFLDDIIFYQRPLRSQKSSIANCSLEYHMVTDDKGVQNKMYLKAIPKSNPYYQEFRIWQWIKNLAIYRREDEENITLEFIQSEEQIQNLFEFLYNRKEVDQKALLKYLFEQKGLKGKELTQKVNEHRWNYVEDKTYPANETRAMLHSRLTKNDLPVEQLTAELELQLWHLIYSVTDREEFKTALKTFAGKHGFNPTLFVEAFQKIPPFPSEYGTYSQKAIKKLLPLMRTGKYWIEDPILMHSDTYLKNLDAQIHKIQARAEKENEAAVEKYGSTVNTKLLSQLQNLRDGDIANFKGLPLYIAQYLVYGRHSEAAEAGKWNSVKDLEVFINDFKQHSLRNPIVEQVLTETLRVVRDIWTKFGNGAQDFFDEIHIELGREMKNSADERKRLTNIVTKNENTNLRIKALLAELATDDQYENIRPHSPIQQGILKIFEEGVLNSDIEIDEDILRISSAAQPSSQDLKRYKLWLEQKYRSPYTGQIIPLSKLFTPAYEIEHIIPRSRFFDDSMSNKVICEAAVNTLKENHVGLGFIKHFHGQIVDCGFGKKVKILEIAEYEDLVKRLYSKNRSKRQKLLLEEIPEEMIERQINDTRYISKYVQSILSNIVRSNENDDGVNSKNVIPFSGKITSELKQDWGLNDIWNELILPRFERMNEITNSKDYTTWNERYKKFLPTVPLEHSKGFSKKRIDHRHHALDALVIASATREHVNYMNNKHALTKKKSAEEKLNFRYELRAQLCRKQYNDDGGNYNWEFVKPWPNFTLDAKEAIEKVIVSFKQNLRVINKATNHFEKWVIEDGKKVKRKVQQKGTNWAIRKPLHKETVSGKVNLSRIKVPKGKILTATRKPLDTSFTLKTIDSITDTGIQKILKNYLANHDNRPEVAFTPEGIADMNRNISVYNDGKPHQPIKKVRVYELGSKFSLGENGNKHSKYVEAAKGTNLFCAVYEDEQGNRSFSTIPLNEVIERLKQKIDPVPPINEQGYKLKFYFSPNDLVFLPDDRFSQNNVGFLSQKNHSSNAFYKVVSFTAGSVFFVPSNVATSIVNKLEFSSLNKMERSIKGIMIKNACLPISISRLGEILPHAQ